MRLYPRLCVLASLMEPMQIDDHTIPRCRCPIGRFIARPRTIYDPIAQPDRFTPAALPPSPTFMSALLSRPSQLHIGDTGWRVLVLATLYQRAFCSAWPLVSGWSLQPLLTLRSKYGMNMRICAEIPA